MLLATQGLRKKDLMESLKLGETHMGRILGELAAEGLIEYNRIGHAVWWSLVPDINLMERLAADRPERPTVIVTVAEEAEEGRLMT